MKVEAGEIGEPSRPDTAAEVFSPWREKAFAGADWDAALACWPLRALRRIADLALSMGPLARLAEQVNDEGLQVDGVPWTEAGIAEVVRRLWPEARWEGILDPNPGYVGPRRTTLELMAACQCHPCERVAFAGPGTCEAFPHGVPNPILVGEHDHRRPYPGDRGLTFVGDQWHTPALQSMLPDIAQDLADLQRTGVISRATELARATGSRVDDQRTPVYFTGNPEAPVVLVHVAPRARDVPERTADIVDVGDYVRRHRAPGLRRFRSPTRRELSDRTLAEFVQPFTVGTLPEPLPSPRVRQAIAVDSVLQLFVVPYRATHLQLERVPAPTLDAHLRRVLDVVVAHERRFVLFCDDAFLEALEPVLALSSETTFRLNRPGGAARAGRGRFRFVNVLFEHEGRPLSAAVTASITTTGLPTAAYAEACRQLYRSLPST